MNTHAHALWMFYLARGTAWRRAAVLWGIMPDLAYGPLLLVYHLRNGWSLATHLHAWDWSWAHPLSCGPHSIVICLLGLGLVRWRWPAAFTAALVGWGSHVLIDALTHVEDAYPLFWPLSDHRFPSVVSYWDARYYGREFFIINHTVLCGIGVVLIVRWVGRRLEAARASAAPAGR